MKKTYFYALPLILLFFIASCSAPDENTKAISGNAAAQQKIGLDRGQTPPDFIFSSLDGKRDAVSSFRGKKPVLLYFWATWCPSCREDLTAAKKIYPGYADRIEYLAMDLDATEDAEMIRQYEREMGLGGKGISFAVGDPKVLSDYKITATTTKYAVGKDGAIIYKGSGALDEKQWEILLNALAST